MSADRTRRLLQKKILKKILDLEARFSIQREIGTGPLPARRPPAVSLGGLGDGLGDGLGAGRGVASRGSGPVPTKRPIV